MDVEAHYKSLTTEFDSLKNRVRNFIEDRHWLTDGEWKESVLRSMLRRHFPDTVRIGRGFVLTRYGPSTQCDILLYKASAPVLFRDQDLVLLTPDAVIGIIEVKTRTTPEIFRDVLNKFSDIGYRIGHCRAQCFFALFSYENEIEEPETILRLLHENCDHDGKIMDLICLGSSTFVKWWKYAPEDRKQENLYTQWHSYDLPNMAAGYFIYNILDLIDTQSISRNSWLWFPEGGKESKKTGAIACQFNPNAFVQYKTNQTTIYFA